MSLLAFILFTSLASSPAFALDCKTKALTLLESLDPVGYQIVHWNKDGNRFLRLLRCDSQDSLYGSLGTLVHETIHDIDSALGTEHNVHGYLLVTGEKIFVPMETSNLEATSFIFSHLTDFEKKSEFAETYLIDSPGQHFDDLLDEVNAYAFGLRTRTLLPQTSSTSNDMAGVLALIDFTLRYYQVSKKLNTEFYQNELQSEQYKQSISKIIESAINQIQQAEHRTDLQLDSESWKSILDLPENKELLKEMSTWK